MCDSVVAVEDRARFVCEVCSLLFTTSGPLVDCHLVMRCLERHGNTFLGVVRLRCHRQVETHLTCRKLEKIKLSQDICHDVHNDYRTNNTHKFSHKQLVPVPLDYSPQQRGYIGWALTTTLKKKQ